MFVTSVAYSLWEKREDPRWLLRASRSYAQYPTANNIAPEQVDLYLRQFSYDLSDNIRDPEFIGKIHLGHRDFLAHFAEDAKRYQWVFKDAYCIELLQQAKGACGGNQLDYLTLGHLEPNVVGNLMTYLLITAVRDMSVAEYSHRRGEISEEEHASALRDINIRMDRIGINGIDRLFEARPELENFLKSDTTVINVGHLPGEFHISKKTRAACYNLGVDSLQRSSTASRLITALREDVIDPNFHGRAEQFRKDLLIHTHDLQEPSPEARARYDGCGVVLGGERDDLSPHHLKMLKGNGKDVSQGNLHSLDEYMNFLIHDGIAINYPHKEKFIADLRAKMAGIIDVGEAATVGEAKPLHAPLTHEHMEKPLVPPALTDMSGEPSPIAGGSDTVLHGEPAKVDGSGHNGNIEDTTTLNEEPARLGQEDQKNSSAEAKGDLKRQDIETPPPKHHDQVEDVAILREETNSDDGKKGATGAKIAALGGAVAAFGVLLAGRSKSESASASKESHGGESDRPEESASSIGKKIAFGVATTVAVGGAVAWARKPEFLYKPLQKLFVLLGGKSTPAL